MYLKKNITGIRRINYIKFVKLDIFYVKLLQGSKQGMRVKREALKKSGLNEFQLGQQDTEAQLSTPLTISNGFLIKILGGKTSISIHKQ